MRDPIRVDQPTGGSFFSGVRLLCKPCELIERYGDSDLSDEYKTSKEWTFEYDGRLFAVYDWKETSFYDPSLPDPETFWRSDVVALHVGSKYGPAVDREFVEALSNALRNTPKKRMTELISEGLNATSSRRETIVDE